MKEHLTIKSQFDQLLLDVIIMSPSHPKGIIQFSHGMCEHKERYFDFMSYLNKQGYLCIIHDHRGHGKSIKNSNDLGFFYEHGDIGIVEDLHQISLFIKKRYPSLPLYLFGHSMGSLVVRCYCQQYDNDIDGLFVCGSPSYNSASGIGITLSKILSTFFGDHHRSSLIQKIGFEAFNKKFNKKIPNSWICSDKNIVDTYNQDPLCHFIFTTNGFETLFRLMQRTYSPQNWQVNHRDLPICFIAGEDDPCIVNEKSFSNAVQFMIERGYKQTTSHLFSHMRHEILNEQKKKMSINMF